MGNTLGKHASLALIGFVATLQSCQATRVAHQISQSYTAPQAVEIDTSETFPASQHNQVWEAVVQFFATVQVPIETIEKDSGIVVARKSLAPGSDGGGFVALGEVQTTCSLLKQSMSPNGFQGSANAAHVRATGTVTAQETVESSRYATNATAAYRASISFNAFVARFTDDEVRLTINVTVAPAESLELYSGWHWRNNLPTDAAGNAASIIAGLQAAGVQPQKLEPTPVSTGKLEKMLLDHVRARLGQKPTEKTKL